MPIGLIDKLIKPRPGVRLNRGHPLGKHTNLAMLFNEGGGTTIHDLSGYGNNGTVNDVGVINSFWELGYPHGRHVHFDATNDDVDIPDAPSLNFSKELSVVVSVNFDSIPVNGSNTIIAKGTNTETAGTNHNFLCTLSNNQFVSGTTNIIGLYEGTAGANQVVNEVFTPTVGTWYQLVFTFDWLRDVQKIYRDGVETASAANTQAVDQNTAPLTIAQWAPTGAEFSVGNLDGKIGYVYLINRAINAAEVASLYANPFQMFQANLSPSIFGRAPVVAGGNEGAAMYHHLQNLGAY